MSHGTAQLTEIGPGSVKVAYIWVGTVLKIRPLANWDHIFIKLQFIYLSMYISIISGFVSMQAYLAI